MATLIVYKWIRFSGAAMVAREGRAWLVYSARGGGGGSLRSLFKKKYNWALQESCNQLQISKIKRKSYDKLQIRSSVDRNSTSLHRPTSKREREREREREKERENTSYI